MPDNISLPDEGYPTLAMQFTRASVNKVLQTVVVLRQQGWPEPKILARMQKDLNQFSPRTLRRLYDLSKGGVPPDDVAVSNVESEKELKQGTLELTVKVAIPGVFIAGELLQHRAACWFVASVSGRTYVLKQLM